jgi:hypothetical protein
MGDQLVICPKCGLAFKFEEIEKHVVDCPGQVSQTVAGKSAVQEKPPAARNSESGA